MYFKNEKHRQAFEAGIKRANKKIKKRCVLFCNKDIIPVEIYVDFFLKRRCLLSILNFFYSINGKSIIGKVV